MSEFNLDHLEPSHFASLEFTEPLVYTEPLALTKPVVYTEPLVFTEQNPGEFLFDGLLHLSWFVPEEMILEQGEMYGGANPWYKVLNTSEREHKKFKIKIKT